jgi:hypothetical protein
VPSTKPSTVPRYSLHAYCRAIGTDLTKQVCAAAGTSFAYFQALAYLTKPCHPAMFARIHAAAEQVTPGIAPDLHLCTDSEVFERARQAKRVATKSLRATARPAAPSL